MHVIFCERCCRDAHVISPTSRLEHPLGRSLDISGEDGAYVIQIDESVMSEQMCMYNCAVAKTTFERLYGRKTLTGHRSKEESYFQLVIDPSFRERAQYYDNFMSSFPAAPQNVTHRTASFFAATSLPPESESSTSN